ncbi:hypothetical protein TPV1_gp25 [Thermococcus prieurii virus 1]|uniref:hypothetical protein n=1 Tax=Thermococcus prieurii virus 1 TaxID=1115696 RepID=UPI00024FB21F|nr:hypothetical protein TPV1_gp25 [Thermococcus prieurii virus 1]AEY69073.1 hypothetical protein [Thermococcus prieurii virus 1]AFA44837.1 hypothetical protein [Thermococcus prieurii virus 1]
MQKVPEPFNDLIIAIDRSQKSVKTKKGKSVKVTVYSWVDIPETKLPELIANIGRDRDWLKHAKEQNKGYKHKFENKFLKIRPLLNRVEITPNQRLIKERLEKESYKLVLLEDKLYEKKGFPTEKAMRESIAKKHKTYKYLMTTADNVAYFGRAIYEERYTHERKLSEIKALLRKLGINLVE